MNLIICNKEKLFLNNFCKWLIKEIQSYSLIPLNIKKIRKFDSIILNYIKLKNKKQKIDTAKIYQDSFYILKWKKSTNDYEIYFDKEAYIPNTETKYIDIIKLINFGTLDITSYNIYEEVFNYFAENLDNYYKIYLEDI